MTVIDTLNPATYPDDIQAFLSEYSTTIIRYHEHKRQTDEYQKSLTQWEMREPNPYGDAYNDVQENLHKLMSTKTVRAFHYTRLVDSEAHNILENGFIAPTTETSWERLSARLNHIINEGHMTRDEADQVIANSPLIDSSQLRIRRGLWMTTSAFHPTDGAVELLVRHWGGEVGYFWIDGNETPDLLTRVQSIGRGRIFEIAIPLSEQSGEPIHGCFGVSQQIVDVFARNNGFPVWINGSDLSYSSNIPATAVLAVHSEGDTYYNSFGKEYPEGISVNPE